MKLLVVYAVEEERVDIPLNDYDIFYLCTGIGKVKAVMKTQEAIARLHPDAVLNLGTSGSVAHSIGDIVVCLRFLDRDLIKIHHPEITARLEFSLEELEKVLPCLAIESPYECGTGDSFVLQESELTSDVCDMEAFAEAMVCRSYGVPFIAVKYVTDKVGENSLKGWEDALKDARNGLSAFFQRICSY